MLRLVLFFLVGVLACGACSAIAADNPQSIAAQRKAMSKDRFANGVVPRSNEPTGELTVLRIWPDDIDMRISIAALQGLVNRDKPKLYIGIDKPLRWLEYYGGKNVTKIEPDIFKVFEKFKDSVKGLVVYDYSLDAISNIAITYAGLEDLIPADPEVAKTLSEKFGWTVVHDLRGKWKTRYEAYKWAYDNLFPKCSKSAMTHYNHGYVSKEADPFGMDSETQKTGFAVDYAVEFRMFNWHTTTEPTTEEMNLTKQILESVPFHTPIFGRSATQDCFPEPAFVSLVAKYGNLHIPSGMSNTSVLSGAQLPPELLVQRQLPPARDSGPDKVYIAFTNSEHDNLEHVIGGGPPWHRLGMETDDPYRIWWSDPWRGRIPVGWPIGPLVADLAPTTLAHFTTTATDNDCLMVALSGLCLSEPEVYGAEYPEMQEELLNEYCKLTGDYMKRLNWTIAQPVGLPGSLKYFVKNIPTLQGVMEGYGPHKGITLDKADYMLDGVPIFHSITNGTTSTDRNRALGEENKRKAKGFADEIKGLNITERPAFIHAWTVGWDFGPTTLKMAADLLPADYVVVRPDELAVLYKKYKGDKAELTSVSPKLTPSGTVTETANGTGGLIVDTGKMKAEIGWGKEAQPPMKRIMGVDGKWRGTGKLLLNNPDRLSIKSFTAKAIKSTSTEKQYQLTYLYSNDKSMIITLTAIAGHPYILVKEESNDPNLASWGFDPYTDFKPDFLHNDAWTRDLDYKGVKAMGGMPWSRWVLAGKKEGAERDLIGVFTISWADWDNGNMIFWQHSPGAYMEIYQSRSGSKEFAFAALDRNNLPDIRQYWNELNSK